MKASVLVSPGEAGLRRRTAEGPERLRKGCAIGGGEKGRCERMHPTGRNPRRGALTRLSSTGTVGSGFIHDRPQRFAVGKTRPNANFARVP